MPAVALPTANNHENGPRINSSLRNYIFVYVVTMASPVRKQEVPMPS